MFRLLFSLHTFIAVGAMGGGLACILNPQEPLGAPVALLQNSPFLNYLIPGIILFTAVGLGNILAALTILYKSKLQGCISNALGWVLIGWIVVQCIMINTIHILHIIFFAIGVIEVILSTILIFKKRLFPADILLNISKK